MNFTPFQLSLLCRLAYFDPPGTLGQSIGSDLTVGRLVYALLRTAIPTAGEREALYKITADNMLSGLRIIDYQNADDTTGFVAYAFGAADASVVLAFRGSEMLPERLRGLIDWIDNLRAPFAGSIQYPDVEQFAAPYAHGALMLTGHSKGGHNALYGLGTSPNRRARATVFDAQGFACRQLNPTAVRAIGLRGINYVQARDPVGALLCHPERRIFVQVVGTGHPHALDAMQFDEAGQPVQSTQRIGFALIGWLSCWFVSIHNKQNHAQPA